MNAVGFVTDSRRHDRTLRLAVALLALAALMVWSWFSLADAGHQAGRLVGEMGRALLSAL